MERKRRRLSKRRNGLYPVQQVVAVAAKGFDKGLSQTGECSFEWNLAPGCHAPVPVYLDGRPARLLGKRHVRADGGRPLGLTLHTKCRKCSDCLRRRRNLWAYRAQEEIKLAHRTWFATFTFAPDFHALMKYRASARIADRGLNIDVLPADDVGAEVSAEYRAEITKYFKRLRKNTGADLRYILVQEQHKSGLPHFHALIHEINPDAPLRHAALTSSWKLGYTRFKLVTALQTAWYVAKYLSKSIAARVRASMGYGQGFYALKHRRAETSRAAGPTSGTNSVAWCPSQFSLTLPRSGVVTCEDYSVKQERLERVGPETARGSAATVVCASVGHLPTGPLGSGYRGGLPTRAPADAGRSGPGGAGAGSPAVGPLGPTPTHGGGDREERSRQIRPPVPGGSAGVGPDVGRHSGERASFEAAWDWALKAARVFRTDGEDQPRWVIRKL